MTLQTDTDRIRLLNKLVYLILVFPLGILYFTFLVTGFSTGLGLSVIGVGLPILLLMFGATRWLAEFERQLAIRLLEQDIPPLPEPADHEPGILGALRGYLTDGSTWRQLSYLVMRLFIGSFTFSIGITVLTLAVTLLPIFLVLLLPVYLVLGGSTRASMRASLGSLIAVVLGLGGLLADMMGKLTALWLTDGAPREKAKHSEKRKLEDLMLDSEDGELVDFPVYEAKEKRS